LQWDRFRLSLTLPKADLSSSDLCKQERVAARHAGVFAERTARADERHPVAEQHTRQRMTHERPAIRLMDEAVTAVAGVLDASVALADAMHVMAE